MKRWDRPPVKCTKIYYISPLTTPTLYPSNSLLQTELTVGYIGKRFQAAYPYTATLSTMYITNFCAPIGALCAVISSEVEKGARETSERCFPM